MKYLKIKLPRPLVTLKQITKILRETTVIQCKGSLRAGDERCVIGVLADAVRGIDQYQAMAERERSTSTALLSQDLGLSSDGVKVLLSLNDRKSLTFRQIATAMETRPDAFFRSTQEL